MGRPDDATERYRSLAHQLASGQPTEVPLWTPEAEIRRSPAAARIGAMASAAGLFCFHFEHRVHLPLPEAWVPAHDPTLADPPTWDAGILAERKYQSFRHDLLIGSFHPHHRAKWSTHELCHGLVGFAWRPDATPFFHACAGRLAELLPVALWYGFDEAFLRRCDRHRGAGALFRTFCPDCETVAAAWPEDPDAADRIAWGLRFVDRELAALARSRRLGRPIPHRYATLDLCSDGIAYARAHTDRLASDAFAQWISRFARPGLGWSQTLDALEERVLAVLAGLLGEADPPALAATSEVGRWTWTLQDIGWRILMIAAEADEDTAGALLSLADDLADGIGDAATPGDPPALRSVYEAYADLADARHLPHPGDVFGVGYALGLDVDGAVTQVREGLESCCALSGALLGDLPPEVARDTVRDFVGEDAPRRAHLATRWAEWLLARHGPLFAELSGWEALVATLPTQAPDHLDGPPADDRWTLADAARARLFDHDVLDIAERVDAGSLVAFVESDQLELVPLDGPGPALDPHAYVLAREAGGELLVLEVDPDTVRALMTPGGTPWSTDPDALETLRSWRVVRPTSWSLTRS